MLLNNKRKREIKKQDWHREWLSMPSIFVSIKHVVRAMFFFSLCFSLFIILIISFVLSLSAIFLPRYSIRRVRVT